MEIQDGIEIRPYQLMCIICHLGEGVGDDFGDDRLTEILKALRANPSVPVTLRANVDTLYRYQNPGRSADTPEGELFNDKRDLDILQRMGLVPGDTRPARELLDRLVKTVPSAEGVCGYAEVTSEIWRGCERARSGFYEKGHANGVKAVIPSRLEDDKARTKGSSAEGFYEASELEIRPHHLMCMACFHGGDDVMAPIQEDNLFEAIDVMSQKPDIPVTLVSGCCMICPPCSQYDPAHSECVSGSGMALRDQKKDLDVLQRMGLSYGVTLPAKELYQRLFDAVSDSTDICGYGDGVERSREWRVCHGSEGSERYRQARASGMGIVPGRR